MRLRLDRNKFDFLGPDGREGCDGREGASASSPVLTQSEAEVEEQASDS